MKIFWEIVLSFAGVIAGFFVAEFVLEKIGLGIKSQKTKINVNELPEYLNRKFLVNCAILFGEKKRFSNLEDQEIAEMKRMIEEMNCREIAIFKDENCKLAIKKGKVLVCVRGKVISMKDLSEISEVIHRALRGVGE
ncbi:MAG: hypothetical protein NZ879_04540 [Archaeoglobaceae archaeon]|nr:hypothetical protein [Archaeoglobaceae archaeon]MDW8118231.1 hypothetical protein [Archaeoglobaceae archaeon]